MAWKHNGYIYKGRRKDGWPNDEHAPDGKLYFAWRKVRNSKVKFDSQWFTHPKLREREGQQVRIEIGDYWGTYYICYLGDNNVTPETYMDHHSSYFKDGFQLIEI